MGKKTGDGEEPKGGHKVLRRVIRLALVAAAVGWIVKKLKGRSTPAEGLWRDGISGDDRGAR